MNRFLKKKSPEPLNTSVANLDDASRVTSPSSRPTSPATKKPSSSRWRRAKKQAPEEKPAVNIATALPSNDDFRTSLLMPNLSARFSMLREQDDPKSLLGKASDDSVLQPRRRSRMADFGHGRANLGDIAEVSSVKLSASNSIKQAVRPPFATESRQHSYASEDGYTSENDSTNTGSMMSRARPGEGNVLFGGRQKVYMIPNAGTASSRSLGRPVYDDDIVLSPFRRYKINDHSDGRPSDDSQAFDLGLDLNTSNTDADDVPNDSGTALSHSPSLSSTEKKRSTTSTSRSEARSSYTAATSVGSHPNTAAPSPAAPTHLPAAAAAAASATPSLKRSDTKTRRMYEQGLDQHMYEQQTSALTRLNSIQRQRTLNNGRPAQGLHGTKSASNLHDKAAPPVFALRAQSPNPPTPPLTSFGSIRKPSSGKNSPSLSGPVSPADGEFDDAEVLNQAMQPGDRGKATAMGAFNKPQQAFDEEQYLERQRQLQRSNSSAAIKKDPAGLTAAQRRLNSFESERQQTDSEAPVRERSPSRSRQESEQPKNSASPFKKSASTPVLPSSQTTTSAASDRSPYPDTHRTFFGDISGSESEDEEPADVESSSQQPDYGYGSHHGRWQPTILPSVSEHPALRQANSKNSLAEEDEEPQAKTQDSKPALLQLPGDDAEKPKSDDMFDESPVVPNHMVPLNGFVHHLRQPSNQSSVFQPDTNVVDEDVPEVPEWNANTLDVVNRHLNTADSESRFRASYATSNPWDLDESNSALNSDTNLPGRAISPNDPQAAVSANPPTSVPEDEAHRQSEVSRISESEAEDGPWSNGIRHSRGASTETQNERNAFADELAARRQAIQQNIKSMVERDANSRGTSPGRSATGGLKAMLRAKSSRETVSDGRRETIVDSSRPPPPPMPNKAMKTLGLAGPGPQTNGSANSYESGSRPRQNSGSRPAPVARVPRPMYSTDQDLRRRTEHSMSRDGSSEMARSEHNHSLQHGRSPASSMASGGRSRANSEAAGNRSRSRTGPYRDDLERAMAEGTGFSNSVVLNGSEYSPAKLRDGIPVASPDAADVEGSRSNSRAGGYFEKKTDRSPGMRPNSPSHYSPSTFVYPAGRPSGSASPVPGQGYAQNMTLPLSAPSPEPSSATTPTANGHPPSPFGVPSSNNPLQQQRPPLRKKTISKHSISEPTLISATSNIDTVDLPEGASLRNGMEPPPPPIPPINPKRRGMKIFGLGGGSSSRTESEDSSHFPTMASSASSSRQRTPPEGYAGSSSTAAASAAVAAAASLAGGSAMNGGRARNGSMASPAAVTAANAAAGTTFPPMMEATREMDLPPNELASSSTTVVGMRDRSASSSPRPSATLGSSAGSAAGRGLGVEVEGAMF